MNFESYAPGYRNTRGYLDHYDPDAIHALCSGRAQAETQSARELVAFIDGPRPLPWPSRIIHCALCATQLRVTAFPGPNHSWQWATVCQSCADRWDAGLHPAHP